MWSLASLFAFSGRQSLKISVLDSVGIFSSRGSIQKEVIFDLKGENKFFPKELWESI